MAAETFPDSGDKSLIENTAASAFEELNLLRRSLAFRDLLMVTVLEDRGTQALADRLAELVANPVVVGNRFFRLIASAGPRDDADTLRRETVRQRGTPREIYELKEFRDLLGRVMSSNQPVYFEPRPSLGMDRARLFAPIFAGRELLGYLAILETTHQLERIDYLTAEHAAVAFGMEIIKERSRLEAEHRVRGGFFSNTLLAEDFDEAYAAEQAAILGYDLSSHYRVMILEASEPETALPSRESTPVEIFSPSLRRDLFAVVNGLIQRRNPGTIIFMKNEELVLVTPVPREESEKAARGRAQDRYRELAEAVRREITWYWPYASICIGISKPFSSLKGVRRAFLEACKGIDIRRTLHREEPIVFFEDLGAYGLLFQPDKQSELLEFAQGMLGPILRYDSTRQSSLLNTLQCYLDTQGNIRQTARTLFLHVHTVNYRLQRIEELAGVDLKDPEDRFNLQLAIRVHQATAA